jgi:hypothetical protein
MTNPPVDSFNGCLPGDFLRYQHIQIFFKKKQKV